MAKDLYFTGWTIIISHGDYLSSTYSHLQDISVQLGDYVNRGEIIGIVGSTGRSTGAHLDWRINWLDKRLDPQLIANKNP
jgi:murein DD-endopeptidase MepM/ murein hydrolase activator NlpD